MNYKKPPMEQLVKFISATHECEKLNAPLPEVNAALKKLSPNPFITSHFDAMNYLFTLVESQDVPCKDVTLIKNTYQSYDALYWLRNLHTKITLPLSKMSHSTTFADQCANVKQWECGTYRVLPTLLVSSVAPEPSLIPKILHNWLLNIATLHTNVKNHVHNPYGVSKEQAYDLINAANNTTLLFANLQPFVTGNNRLGRLVENILRLKWQLTWQDVPHDYPDFMRKIDMFNQNQMPDIIKAARNVP